LAYEGKRRHCHTINSIENEKKKPLINTSESWKRVWNINIYEQCKLGPATPSVAWH
jgi:hypothetical protein